MRAAAEARPHFTTPRSEPTFTAPGREGTGFLAADVQQQHRPSDRRLRRSWLAQGPHLPGQQWGCLKGAAPTSRLADAEVVGSTPFWLAQLAARSTDLDFSGIDPAAPGAGERRHRTTSCALVGMCSSDVRIRWGPDGMDVNRLADSPVQPTPSREAKEARGLMGDPRNPHAPVLVRVRVKRYRRR